MKDITYRWIALADVGDRLHICPDSSWPREDSGHCLLSANGIELVVSLEGFDETGLTAVCVNFSNKAAVVIFKGKAACVDIERLYGVDLLSMPCIGYREYEDSCTLIWSFVEISCVSSDAAVSEYYISFGEVSSISGSLSDKFIEADIRYPTGQHEYQKLSLPNLQKIA